MTVWHKMCCFEQIVLVW